MSSGLRLTSITPRTLTKDPFILDPDIRTGLSVRIHTMLSNSAVQSLLLAMPNLIFRMINKSDISQLCLTAKYGNNFSAMTSSAVFSKDFPRLFLPRPASYGPIMCYVHICIYIYVYII
jgi:hypothetical protein